MEELWNRLFGRGFNVLVKIVKISVSISCAAVSKLSHLPIFFSLSLFY